jgi:hypothetical protein
MATISSAVILDGIATLAISDATGFQPGAVAYIFGVGNGLDGARQLTAVNGDDDEISYTTSKPNTTAAITPTAAVAETAVTWIDEEAVEWFIGIELASGADEDYLASVTSGANEWSYRRRYAAGYDDHPANVPSASVKAGTVMYAGLLYRERGSADVYASFDQMGSAPIGSLVQVMRLLGINRGAIA